MQDLINIGFNGFLQEMCEKKLGEQKKNGHQEKSEKMSRKSMSLVIARPRDLKIIPSPPNIKITKICRSSPPMLNTDLQP